LEFLGLTRSATPFYNSEIELSTNCVQLKLKSGDDKEYETDCANTLRNNLPPANPNLHAHNINDEL